MTYIGGEGTGYEAVKAPLLCRTGMDERRYFLRHMNGNLWTNRFLSIHDKDAQWWEKLTQYKSTVLLG